MSLVDVYVRYSKNNVVLEKVGTLSIEDKLVFKDEGDNFKAHAISTTKFTMITVASPLIAIARLVRSVAFAFTGDFKRAGREFVGGLAVPLVASGCLVGSLLSSFLCVLSLKKLSFYVPMRRTYAYFEAWVNDIDFKSKNLESYSNRVSLPMNVMGNKKGMHKKVWTTAPCMQPLLENSDSVNGGIYDVERMKKIFPHLKINGIQKEKDQFVLQSEYANKKVLIEACNGACAHAQTSQTCCCYRLDAVFDRFLCCEAGQANCTSIANKNESCGFVFCSMGCIGVCCCTQKNNLGSATSCCLI